MLPRLIVGLMRWGDWGAQFNTSQMSKQIRACTDLGLFCFDHADIYGHYTTEEAFGLAFQQTGLNRQQIQLISKCGLKYPNNKTTYRIKHYDYDAKYIISSVERSLKCLQTDYLDIFLLHRPSPLMQAEEVAKAIQELKSSGKIIEFGVSNFGIDTIKLLQLWLNIEHQQIEISLTAHQSLTNGMLDFLKSQNINTMAWNPLGNFFSGQHPNYQKIKKVLKRLSKQYEVSLDAVLLAWLLKHPHNIVPVIGTTKQERIKAQMMACSINLSLEDWFCLWEAAMGCEVP